MNVNVTFFPRADASDLLPRVVDARPAGHLEKHSRVSGPRGERVPVLGRLQKRGRVVECAYLKRPDTRPSIGLFRLKRLNGRLERSARLTATKIFDAALVRQAQKMLARRGKSRTGLH